MKTESKEREGRTSRTPLIHSSTRLGYDYTSSSRILAPSNSQSLFPSPLTPLKPGAARGGTNATPLTSYSAANENPQASGMVLRFGDCMRVFGQCEGMRQGRPGKALWSGS
jgi:hypothetical protein